MQLLIKIIIVLGIVELTTISGRNALHMFQQNRYELQRYLKWLNNRWQHVQLSDFILAGYSLVICILEFYHLTITALVLLYGLIFYLYFRQTKKEVIKPLVYTNRVKRQILILGALYVILYYLGYQNFNLIYGIILGFYGIWLMVLIMHFISSPIEKLNRQRYLRQAKNILRQHQRLIKIGITGSYGKTSSKNIIQAVLSENYYSLMTPASYNTPMGITRVIRGDLKPIHEVFVCEMGADHVNDIQELCDFVHPKYGVVTSIGPQHLNTFKTQANIINEKMKLIENLPLDGVGVINVDNEFIRQYNIKNTCKIISYGIDYPADIQAKNIVYSKNGSSFDVYYQDEKYSFKTRLLGKHNVSNILASIALALQLNVSLKDIQKAVLEIPYIEHRLEIKKINGYTFIDNAFNSNPEGAAMSLEVLKMMDHQRFIITPGMIDLGAIQEQTNYEFAKKMPGKVDQIILVGKQQTKSMYQALIDVKFDLDKVHVVDNVKQAFALVYQLATIEDTILLENDLPDAFNN